MLLLRGLFRCNLLRTGVGATALLIMLLLNACGGAALPPATATPTATATNPPASPTTAPTAVPTPANTAVVIAPGSEKMIQLTRDDLSKMLTVPAKQIDFAGSLEQQWSDSSLGCPQRGQDYLQVITPGFIIRHVVSGKLYEYHSDRRNSFILCSGSKDGPASKR